MKSQWLMGVLLLAVQSLVVAEERRAVVDLTTQQYRVESLQNEHYQLKLQQDALKEKYNKQKARVDSLEKSLAEANKTLASNKTELDKHKQTMKVFDKRLSVEEKKLNEIWDQTRRRQK